MTNKDRINKIISYFDEILPQAHCELNYSKPYELLIAVMLSAQTTDKSVNKVTAVLFDKYKTLDSLANATYEEVFDIIKTLGLAKTKAENVIKISKALIEKYNYEVPNDQEQLMSLSGVGRKTSNVVRGELYNEPVIAVDTHVERVSKRLYLAKVSDAPLNVELKLLNLVPKQRRVLFHHQMIHFGRYYCMSKKPKCENCKLKDQCRDYSNR
jgi:endonuclease-3